MVEMGRTSLPELSWRKGHMANCYPVCKHFGSHWQVLVRTHRDWKLTWVSCGFLWWEYRAPGSVSRPDSLIKYGFLAIFGRSIDSSKRHLVFPFLPIWLGIEAIKLVSSDKAYVFSERLVFTSLGKPLLILLFHKCPFSLFLGTWPAFFLIRIMYKFSYL